MNQTGVMTIARRLPQPMACTTSKNIPEQIQVTISEGIAPAKALPKRSSHILTGVASKASKLPESFSSTMLNVAMLIEIITGIKSIKKMN